MQTVSSKPTARSVTMMPRSASSTPNQKPFSCPPCRVQFLPGLKSVSHLSTSFRFPTKQPGAVPSQRPWTQRHQRGKQQRCAQDVWKKVSTPEATPLASTAPGTVPSRSVALPTAGNEEGLGICLGKGMGEGGRSPPQPSRLPHRPSKGTGSGTHHTPP